MKTAQKIFLWMMMSVLLVGCGESEEAEKTLDRYEKNNIQVYNDPLDDTEVQEMREKIKIFIRKYLSDRKTAMNRKKEKKYEKKFFLYDSLQIKNETQENIFVIFWKKDDLISAEMKKDFFAHEDLIPEDSIFFYTENASFEVQEKYNISHLPTVVKLNSKQQELQRWEGARFLKNIISREDE